MILIGFVTFLGEYKFWFLVSVFIFTSLMFLKAIWDALVRHGEFVSEFLTTAGEGVALRFTPRRALLASLLEPALSAVSPLAGDGHPLSFASANPPLVASN